MKIIIVGGGIAGLSTYLHLCKHVLNTTAHTIILYESHKPRPKDSNRCHASSQQHQAMLDLDGLVGGGLGISPNGMRILRDLDIDLHDRVVAQGFPAEKFIFKGANGWTLGVQSTSDKTVRTGSDEAEVCIASSRHGLWETIMHYAREKHGCGVVQYRKVVGVEKWQGGTFRVRSVDETGNEAVEEADLIVGADGVKSVVRAALFGDDSPYQPVYSGQCGVGGFLTVPIPPLITCNRAMVFSFGGNGFFGYSSGGPPSSQQLMWWSTFETSILPDTKTIDPQYIRATIQERHKHWKDATIQDIIQKADIESIYPTWTLPILPHWGEQGLVLVGDAAHAMDPTTGQGASQALEDSQTLALLLAELVEIQGNKRSESDAVDVAAKLFYQIRAPRVHAIVQRGKKIARRKTNVGLVAEYSTYFFLWLLNKFPAIGQVVLGNVHRELYAWSAEEEVKKALKEKDTMSTETISVYKAKKALAKINLSRKS